MASIFQRSSQYVLDGLLVPPAPVCDSSLFSRSFKPQMLLLLPSLPFYNTGFPEIHEVESQRSTQEMFKCCLTPEEKSSSVFWWTGCCLLLSFGFSGTSFQDVLSPACHILRFWYAVFTLYPDERKVPFGLPMNPLESVPDRLSLPFSFN